MENPYCSCKLTRGQSTADYDEQDGFMEMEAHDRTEIGLPSVQRAFARAVLALGKPTVVFLLNAGAVSIDEIAAHAGPAPLAIIEVPDVLNPPRPPLALLALLASFSPSSPSSTFSCPSSRVLLFP